MFRFWLVLAVLSLFLILIPAIGAARAQGAFSLLALLALGPLFYRRSPGGVVGDERDRLIHLRSLQIAFAVVWLGVMASLWGVYWVHHGTGVLLVQSLPIFAWCFWIAFELSQSASVLLLYRRM